MENICGINVSFDDDIETNEELIKKHTEKIIRPEELKINEIPCNECTCGHNSLRGKCMFYLTKSLAREIIDHNNPCKRLYAYSRKYLSAMRKPIPKVKGDGYNVYIR